jgi:D-alanyl-D-alanine dipeptidase
MVILLMANHKENQWEFKGEIYTVGPGQFVTSLDSIKQNCAKDVSIQNIRTALLKLEKWGFLTSKSTNKNRLITVVNWEVYQPQEKNQQTDQQATNKQLTTNKNVKNEEKNNNDQPGGRSKNVYPDDFERFWSVYPKKIEKKKALSLWKARTKEISKENLMIAAQNYAKHCEIKGTDPDYIKYPSTFLSKKMDYQYWIEYKPEKQKSKSNVTPFPGKPKTEGVRVNMPSSIDEQRQMSVEEEMRRVKEERMRKRKEAQINGA